jgi:hypothetical protein
MSILDKAKAAAEKAATEASEALKSAGAKAAEFAQDSLDKAKSSSLVQDISDAAGKAKDFASEAASDIADAAKKAGSAALDKAEEWTGKDLNNDGKVGGKDQA